MKWIKNGIEFKRGDYVCLIAKYDTRPEWFAVRATATQQTQKSNFKDLGEYLNAGVVEVKEAYDDDENPVEKNVLLFDNKKAYGGGFSFWLTNDEMERTGEKINI